MKLAQKYSIHLLVDEIYAQSVYTVPGTAETEAPSSFQSVLALEWQQFINPTYLHVLYGFSKDLASGGLRLGVLWTRNAALLRALSGLSRFSWTSTVSEAIGITMLEDEGWMESFLQTSRERLGARSALARSVLDEYGIPYERSATAGFFLWLDVRPFLGENKDSEVTWDDERAVVKRMQAKKVYLTEGEILASEKPGFFRLCFVKDELEVREGLKRLAEALDIDV
jgi:aspartate/methionine/tyrosine aminotransferase